MRVHGGGVHVFRGRRPFFLNTAFSFDPSTAIVVVRVSAAVLVSAALAGTAEMVHLLPAALDTVIGIATAAAWTFWLEREER